MMNLVINFHGIGDPPPGIEEGEAEVWTSVEEMNRILDLAEGRPEVAITSDDGNVSDLEILLPALLKRRLTATFFVLTGRIGKPGFLDEQGIGVLVESGMRIGLHGHAHVSWRGLDVDAARIEWFEARERLAAVSGQSIEDAACPFGRYDRGTIGGLRRAGISRIFTSDRGWFRSGAMPIPRNSVGTSTSSSVIEELLERPRIPFIDSLRRTVKRWR
ncbi:MAG: glycosyl transferase family 2 [Phycisphaerae bacterium]|nr:glycosyl transferase family 2 [Phycisphaerae bacterium]